MDVGSILVGVGGVVTALGGGAAGREFGNRVGSSPWQKITAPAGAASLAMLYNGVTGDHVDIESIVVSGATIGTIAVGVFSILKNIKELFIHLKER